MCTLLEILLRHHGGICNLSAWGNRKTPEYSHIFDRADMFLPFHVEQYFQRRPQIKRVVAVRDIETPGRSPMNK